MSVCLYDPSSLSKQAAFRRTPLIFRTETEDALRVLVHLSALFYVVRSCRTYLVSCSDRILELLRLERHSFKREVPTPEGKSQKDTLAEDVLRS